MKGGAPRIFYLLFLLTVLAACSDDDEDDVIVWSDYYEASGQGDSLKCDTGLPVISIRTENGVGITSKEDWLHATISVWTKESGWTPATDIQIKGRGNATWQFPKKPFNVKFPSKYALLGMPQHRRWVFLANYHDRTLLRNALTFHLGSLMEGLEWTPRFRFAEVVFNGHHVGNYLVCEQIRVSPQRVDIDEMKQSDVDGEQITGGYLLSFDSYYDETNKFMTRHEKWPVEIKSPDEDILQDVQLQYISHYIEEIETLMRKGRFAELRQEMDYDSFADYYIIQTLTGNKELKKPRSVYAYKKRSGSLYAGPLWDFDYSTYNKADANYNVSALWYKYLLKDTTFVNRLKARWAEKAPGLQSAATAFLDSMVVALDKSQELNFQLFPIRNDIVKKYENGDEELPFAISVEHMKDILCQRMEKMTAFIHGR